MDAPMASSVRSATIRMVGSSPNVSGRDGSFQDGAKWIVSAGDTPTYASWRRILSRGLGVSGVLFCECGREVDSLGDLGVYLA